MALAEIKQNCNDCDYPSSLPQTELNSFCLLLKLENGIAFCFPRNFFPADLPPTRDASVGRRRSRGFTFEYPILKL